MHSRWADPFHYNPDHQQYVPLTLCLSPTVQSFNGPCGQWAINDLQLAACQLSDRLHFLTLSEIRIPSVQSVRLQMVDPAGRVRAELYIQNMLRAVRASPCSILVSPHALYLCDLMLQCPCSHLFGASTLLYVKRPKNYPGTGKVQVPPERTLRIL